MDTVKSIEEFKRRATVYPKGRIVPKAMMKSVRLKSGTNHPLRHMVKFGAKVWVIFCGSGYVIVPEEGEGNCCIRLGDTKKRFYDPPRYFISSEQEREYRRKPRGLRNVAIKCRNTFFQGSHGLTPEEHLEKINEAIEAQS